MEKTNFTKIEVKNLFDLLYKLENFLEVKNNKNYGIVTKIIQDLNLIGIK